MGDVFSDRQTIVTRKKESLDFHTPSWRSITVEVTPISKKKDKNWFLSMFA